MYGTIINDTLVIAPNPVRLGDVVYYNPTDATYRTAGYLPVVKTPCPAQETDPEAADPIIPLAARWELQEQEGYILQVWSPAEA